MKSDSVTSDSIEGAGVRAVADDPASGTSGPSSSRATSAENCPNGSINPSDLSSLYTVLQKQGEKMDRILDLFQNQAKTLEQHGKSIETQAAALNAQGNEQKTLNTTLNAQGNAQKTLNTTLNAQGKALKSQMDALNAQWNALKTLNTTLNSQGNALKTQGRTQQEHSETLRVQKGVVESQKMLIAGLFANQQKLLEDVKRVQQDISTLKQQKMKSTTIEDHPGMDEFGKLNVKPLGLKSLLPAPFHLSNTEWDASITARLYPVRPYGIMQLKFQPIFKDN